MARPMFLEGSTTLERPAALITDDDQPTRETVSFFLHEEGYTVLEAGEGDEARLLMHDATLPPLIVVLDLFVRSGTGFDILQALRRACGGRVCGRHQQVCGVPGAACVAWASRRERTSCTLPPPSSVGGPRGV